MIDEVVAWVAIGAAASLAAMVLPFRRGVAGIVLNIVACVAGAVVAGLISTLAIPLGRPHAGPWHLFFAALGAMAGLLAVHAPRVRLHLSKLG